MNYIFFIFLLVSFSGVNGQKNKGTTNFPNAKVEILRLDSLWANSFMHYDSGVLKKILATEYINITANGKIQTKKAFIKDLEENQKRFTSVGTKHISVRFYGNAAVIIGEAFFTGVHNNHYSYTHVFAKKKSMWQIVSTQAAKQ